MTQLSSILTTLNSSCKFCKKTYARQHLLSNHVRISHPKADFTCSQCQKCFDNMKKLKAHEHVHLPRESKFSSTCPYCDKKFTKSVNVQAHIRSVHQQQRPFLCNDCGKDFTTKGALKEHQIIHSNEAPYQCRFWWDFYFSSVTVLCFFHYRKVLSSPTVIRDSKIRREWRPTRISTTPHSTSATFVASHWTPNEHWKCIW